MGKKKFISILKAIRRHRLEQTDKEHILVGVTVNHLGSVI